MTDSVTTHGVTETPFWQRLSTRLGVLILLVVMVLAGATVILVGRGFNRVNISTQQLQASGIEPTAELRRHRHEHGGST